MTKVNFSYQLDNLLNQRLDQRTFDLHLNKFLRDVANVHQDEPTKLIRILLERYDIDRFGEILALVVNKDQELDSIAPENRIEVREESVNLRYERDAILWKVLSRKPGKFSKGPVGSDGVREYTSHYRGEYEDINNPGSSIIEYGMWMENMVCLTVVSSDAGTANRRAIWLEGLIEENKWIFTLHGFSRVIFYEREEDEFIDLGSNPFYVRKLIYFVKTEKIVRRRAFNLRRILIDLQVIQDGE